MKLLSLPFDGVCSHCHEMIEAGTEALFVQGVGIMHVDCQTQHEIEPTIESRAADAWLLLDKTIRGLTPVLNPSLLKDLRTIQATLQTIRTTAPNERLTEADREYLLVLAGKLEKRSKGDAGWLRALATGGKR